MPLLVLVIWAAEPSSARVIADERFKYIAQAEAEHHVRIQGDLATLQDRQDGTTADNLTKRVSETYQQARNRGIILQCLLDTANLDRAQAYLTAQGKGAKATSIWTDYFNLESNGWSLYTDGPGFEEDDYSSIFGVTMSNNIYQRWVQDLEVVNGGSVTIQMIAADENYSPLAMTGSGAKIVPLQAWSDVLFLAWQQLCGTTGNSISGLRKLFQISVVNQDSLEILSAAVESAGGSMEVEWANRVKYAAGTPGFYAILGSANGRGVAWLLLQHRPQMSHLTILSVSYFLEPESEDNYLSFEIGPFTTAAEPSEA